VPPRLKVLARWVVAELAVAVEFVGVLLRRFTLFVPLSFLPLRQTMFFFYFSLLLVPYLRQVHPIPLIVATLLQKDQSWLPRRLAEPREVCDPLRHRQRQIYPRGSPLLRLRSSL